MKTITEVKKLTGFEPQRINDYEKAGLLPKPQHRNKYNYRLYDERDIARLLRIKFYKELGYNIPEMKEIFNDPNYDPAVDIRKQISELEKKKRQIEVLIRQAEALRDYNLDIATAHKYLPIMEDFNYDESKTILFADSELSRFFENLDDEEIAAAFGLNFDDSTMDYLSDWLDDMEELFETRHLPNSDETQACVERAIQHLHISQLLLVSLPIGLQAQEISQDIIEAYGQDYYDFLSAALASKSRKTISNWMNGITKAASMLEALYQEGTDPQSPQTQASVHLLLDNDYCRFILEKAGPAVFLSWLSKLWADPKSPVYTSTFRKFDATNDDAKAQMTAYLMDFTHTFMGKAIEYYLSERRNEEDNQSSATNP